MTNAEIQEHELYEADPFCRVELHIEKETTRIIHEADLSLNTTIEGLKEDMVEHVGYMEQDWYYLEDLMQDNKTLEYYGFDGKSKRLYRIIVRQQK